MCWHGLKDTTKDADLVFLTKKEALAFRNAVLVCGFMECEIVDLPGDYADMNPFGIFDEVKHTPIDEEFTPGIRIDVFAGKVCGIFNFSKGMQNRCVKGLDYKNLVGMVCACEDIFLFKSVTYRERDIEDMNSLYKKGLNWQVIADELKIQIESLDPDLAKEYLKVVSGRWRLFSRRFGVKIPIDLKNIEKRD